MALDTRLSGSPLGLSVFFNSQMCPSLWLRALKWVFSNEDSYKDLWGFPGGSDGKESACNAEDPGLIPRLGRFPWRRELQLIPVFLPGEFHGQRSLGGL